MNIGKIIFATLAITLLSVAGMANAETWRLGLEENEGSVQYQYATEFKKLIEQESDGDVTVQILPYGTWGSNYSDLYHAIQHGSIQLGFGSGALAGTVPESQLLVLNFVMPDDEHKTVQVLNSDEFTKSEAWQSAFREAGLVPLANLTEGYQVWTANKPIHTPEDMKNLRIRVMDNSLLRKTYKAYGASPISVAYGEIYSALQQGQADAVIEPVFAMENMSFYEVQDYMIFADQAHFVATLMGSEKWWKTLDDEQQSMLEDVVGQMVEKGYEIQTQFAKERLDKIKEDSDIQMIRLTDSQRDQFRELVKPVREEFVDETGERGQKLLDLILKLSKDTPTES